MSDLEKIRKEVLGRKLRHSFTLDRAAVDQESRTVNVAFASDLPIDHYYFKLALTMTDKAMRSDRLKAGAALLMDHNWRDQVGVVENFSIEGGVARAGVRFSRSARAEEIYQDVVDGIRQNISVGFIVHEIHLESETDGELPLYRSDDWEPFEISIVSVPADISVGVGRSAAVDGEMCPDCEVELEDGVCPECGYAPEGEDESERKVSKAPETRAAIKKPTERKMEKETKPEDPVVDNTTARHKDLVEWAAIFGEENLARTLIAQNSDTSREDIRLAIKAKRDAQPDQAPVPAEDPNAAAARQGGRVEIVSRARASQLRSFRGEGAVERAYRAGQFLRAVLTQADDAVRYCREHGITLTRAHSGTSNETGGFLVPDEFENVLIDLRIEYGVFRRNANVVPMMSDTKARPRRTGGLTAYPIGAGVAITESTKGWDRVTLTAKKWGVLTKYESELSEDAVINLADDLASEIAYAFTQKEDQCGFEADGSSTYHGIVGVRTKIAAATAGLKTATGNTYAEVTLPDLVGVVGLLPQFARRSGAVKWYCSNVVWANVLERLALAAGGTGYADIKGEMTPVFLGKPVEIVEVMPTAEANDQICLLYGNLAQAAMFGDRRGVTIAMSDSDGTDFAEDVMAIRGTERFDINAHDVGNTSVAGPIVGLKLASS